MRARSASHTLIEPLLHVTIRLVKPRFSDGKPAFHPTVTPKTEEILQELTGILLDDDCDDEHENVKGPKLYQ